MHGKVAGHGLGGFAVVVASDQGTTIGLGDVRMLAELVVDIAHRRIERTIVEPEDQAHCIEVSAAVGVFRAETEPFNGVAREPGHLDGKQLIA